MLKLTTKIGKNEALRRFFFRTLFYHFNPRKNLRLREEAANCF